MNRVSTSGRGLFSPGTGKRASALRTVWELSSKGLGFLVSRGKVATRSSDKAQNRHAQGRLRLTAAALRAGAASLGLSCLGGSISVPAAAFPYGEYVPFWDYGIESHALKWHQSRRRHGAAKTAESAKPEAPKQASGPLILAVSIGSQRVTVYDNGTPIATSPISTGMAGHLTPMGVFSVIQKQRWHHSNLYSNAPMPYMQRITWSGVALHAGVVPGYPASHGCIRLPERFAVRLWGMTRVGARVVVTRNDAAPYAINHPLLAELVRTTEPAPEAGTLNTPNSAANTNRSEIITGGVVVASTDTPAAAAPEKLHDGSEHSALITDASTLPQVERVATVDRPAELRSAAIEPSAPEPVATPDAKTPDTSRRSDPISLFVSRKEGKLFVRKGFVPVFDTPITIANREMPLGTHIFTANRPTDDSTGVRWLAVSIGYDRAAPGPAHPKGKARGMHDERPMPPTADALRQAAVEALDRIELSREALDRIVPLVAPGTSLLISDQGLGEETGRDTDFIVVTR
jgi:L,D-transpeptidase-like protein